jgi:hypothetical protein
MEFKQIQGYHEIYGLAERIQTNLDKKQDLAIIRISQLSK